MMLSFIATIMLAQADCEYRQMVINDFDAGTVLHVRTMRGDEVRYFGYHESGVYPYVVDFEWCGPGWTVEYRLGSECTYVAADGSVQRRKQGARQRPCEWSNWMPIPGHLVRPKPPEVIRV